LRAHFPQKKTEKKKRMKKHSLFFFVSFLKIYRSFLFFLSLKNPFFPFLFFVFDLCLTRGINKKKQRKNGGLQEGKNTNDLLWCFGKRNKNVFYSLISFDYFLFSHVFEKEITPPQKSAPF
jgi:hypothetical protein